MKKKVIVALAMLITASIFTVKSSINSEATSVTDVMPAGGFALELEEGAAFEDICVESEENDSQNTLDASTSEDVENGYGILSENNSVSEAVAGDVLSGNESCDATVSENEIEDIDIAQVVTSPVGQGFERALALNDTMIAEVEELAARDPENFSNLVIAQVTNYVNVRDIPSEDGEVVGKLYDDSVGEFLGEEDGWYKITSGHVTGYVKAEYCVTGEAAIDLAREVGTRVATVNTTTLKIRREASTDAEVLGLVPIEEDLSVIEELDGWVKVSIEEGEGYVSAEYVNLRTDFVTAESKAEEEARLAAERKAQEEARAAAAAAAARTTTNTGNSSSSSSNTYAAPNFSNGSGMGSSVAQYACQFVGNPYVYGGSSLTNGTDCSGFVMSVYAAYGVSLPHSSTADRTVGSAVEGGLSNAQPGDIVCYSGHVALYIGNGQIVHASTSRTGIIISNASYRNVLAVRRIF